MFGFYTKNARMAVSMLPDFPSLKRKIVERILVPAFEEARVSDPLLGRIKSTIQHEGRESRYQTVDGTVKQQKYEKFQAEFRITPDEVIDKDFDYMVEKFRKLGVEALSQMAQYSFKTINKVIDEVGNSIDAKGRKKSSDLILEILDKILIDFDEESGQAKMPTFYIHPSQSEAYRKVVEEAKQNPEFKRKFDQLIERKRKEWYDREAVRKLVD